MEYFYSEDYVFWEFKKMSLFIWKPAWEIMRRPRAGENNNNKSADWHVFDFFHVDF